MELVAFVSYLAVWWLFWTYRYPRHPGGWDATLWPVFMFLLLAGGFPLASIADERTGLALGGSLAVLGTGLAVDYVAWRKRPGNGSYTPLVGPRRSGNGRALMPRQRAMLVAMNAGDEAPASAEVTPAEQRHLRAVGPPLSLKTRIGDIPGARRVLVTIGFAGVVLGLLGLVLNLR